jgi:hypothetical protein
MSRPTAVLYALTGILTAIPVAVALLWAGASYGPVSTGEYISIVGSVILLIAALQATLDRNSAAWIALLGSTLVWSFYLPTIAGLLRIRLSDQRLTVRVLIWRPLTASTALVNPKSLSNLSQFEARALKDLGINGALMFKGTATFGSGKPSSVLIIIRHPVQKPIELKEPDSCQIVYVQHDGSWAMYPPNAHTLSRTILIQPVWKHPEQNQIMTELSTGARMGFGISDWSVPNEE